MMIVGDGGPGQAHTKSGVAIDIDNNIEFIHRIDDDFRQQQRQKSITNTTTPSVIRMKKKNRSMFILCLEMCECVYIYMIV